MTSQAQHTPGPWKKGKGGDSNVRVYNKRGTVICQFHNGLDEEYEGCRNAEANARLIAAAPELLEALRTLHDHLVTLAEIRVRDGRPRPLDELALCEAAHDVIDAVIRKATEP